MSTTIERKVKKKPVMVHRPRKVINSKEKSLHRSVLSHSRIATGYKKKIAALLGNNRALAHALELAHIELTNRDKLTIELQRRLTLQSPKRFKAKLQKVCEHLHIIVALLQDVLDDCEDAAESNLCSFNLQTSNCSRPDIINGGQGNESFLATEQHLTNDLANGNVEINMTPFANLQQAPQLTAAAEMSAILEQSILSDENMPPILFPEDESQVISNITTRPRSKSKSSSSKSRSRGSKIHSESPQKKNSTNATTLDNGNNPNSEVTLPPPPLSPLSPPPVSFKSSPSPKRNSLNKKSKHEENQPSPVINKSNCIDESRNDFLSPEKISNSKKCVKRKSASKRKSKKKILVVKLACTPKRSLTHENGENTITKEQHQSFVTPEKSPNRRKTFIVNKKIDKTLIPEETNGTVDAASEVPNSKPLNPCANKVLSSSDQFYNQYGGDTNSKKVKKGKSDSDNTIDAHRLITTIRNDCTCVIPEDMDLTCQSLVKKSFNKETNAEKNETGDLNNLSLNGTKPVSNFPCSSLMYGYDPLEGTSKNRKSSILLKKAKLNGKSSSKIPTKLKLSKSPTSKINANICRSDTKSVCINSDVIRNESLKNSSTKSHSSLSLKHNSQSKNSQHKIFDLHEDFSHPTKGDQLESNVNRKLSKSLLNHSPLNGPAKESKIVTWTESDRDQDISLDSVQPVVKLNDIWTSVKSPSLTTNHCNNYAYISDSLTGGVLKVDTTPKRKPLILPNGPTMQNEENEIFMPTDGSKTVETISERVDNSTAAELNSEGIRKRRGTSSVSYKEPSGRKKLRQGDPFTSDIYFGKNRPTKSNPTKRARSCVGKKSYFEGDTSGSDD